MQFPVDVDGHHRCRNPECGALVPEHVSFTTKGLCFQCFVDGPLDRVKQIEVLHRAQRIPIKVKPSKVKNKKKKRTPEQIVRSHAVTRAKYRAMTRLKSVYPDMYDVLYAEERHRRGLDPVPRRSPEGACYTAVVTYDPAEHYAPDRTVGAPANGT